MSRRIVDRGKRHDETSSRALYYIRKERGSRPSQASLTTQREAKSRNPQARLMAFTRIERAGSRSL